MRHYIELIWFKACADLRAEASRAYLGMIWWVLEPVLYMVVFYVVFGVLLQRGGEDFIAFLLCGLVTWRWFGGSIVRGANSIPGNARLTSQVYLPKYLFPAIVVTTNTIKFLIVFALLLLYLGIAGVDWGWAWTALPLVLAVQLLFVTACAALLAAVVPFIPDLMALIDKGLALMFFMSGIFYDINRFPESVRVYFQLNPMAVLIENYRAVLLHDAWPDWQDLALVLLVSLLGLSAALYLLVRFDRVYPKAALS